MFRLISISFISLYLIGCSSPSRYHVEQDYGPSVEVDVSRIPDAVPKWEPYSSGANDTYRVRGETYHVLPTSNNFREVGIASWYGHKFHGHLTSNGETYDMYGMSAAHKSLPIPSYVRVTNVDNGRSVVVRVNDRGPFHDGRVIDLSYAAAAKLGYHKKGTAKVIVESIDMDVPDRYVQIGAFGSLDNARKLRQKSGHWTDRPFRIKPESGVFKVQIGPLKTAQEAQDMINLAKSNGILKPLVVFDRI